MTESTSDVREVTKPRADPKSRLRDCLLAAFDIGSSIDHKGISYEPSYPPLQ